MKIETFPQSFQRPEQSFRAFYRDQLRKVVGARLSSRDLHAAYHAWAAIEGAPGLSFKEIARLMRLIGHRPIHSNGHRYLDAGFAVDHPHVSASITARPAELGIAQVIDRVDRALADLSSLRTELCGLVGRVQNI